MQSVLIWLSIIAAAAILIPVAIIVLKLTVAILAILGRSLRFIFRKISGRKGIRKVYKGGIVVTYYD